MKKKNLQSPNFVFSDAKKIIYEKNNVKTFAARVHNVPSSFASTGRCG